MLKEYFASGINTRYYQDSYVQLYNETTNKYFNIYNGLLTKLGEIIKNVNICVSNRCKYIKRRSESKKIIEFCKDQEITVHPNLFNLEYGEVKKKSINIIGDTFINDSGIIIQEDKLRNSFGEQSKGGNFISGPQLVILNRKLGYPIFYIKGPSIEYIKLLNCTRSHLIELQCGFTAPSGFRHIDEIMCFMPYGQNENGTINYKIWFYDTIEISSFLIIKSLEQIEKLNTERMQNLNTICQALFQVNYDETNSAIRDKFVFFKYYSYLPSIFNRVWIETNNLCILLYPNISQSNQTIFELDKEQLKSCINPLKNVVKIQLNIPKQDEIKPEGGLHCLIKQRFSTNL